MKLFLFSFALLFLSSLISINFAESINPGTGSNGADPVLTFSIIGFSCSSDPLYTRGCAVNDYVNVSISTDGQIPPQATFALTFYNPSNPYYNNFGCVSDISIIQSSANNYTLQCSIFGIGSSANYGLSLNLNVLLETPLNYSMQTLNNAATFVDYPRPFVSQLVSNDCNFTNGVYQCPWFANVALIVDNFDYYLPFDNTRSIIPNKVNIALRISSVQLSSPNITYEYFPGNPLFYITLANNSRALAFSQTIGDALQMVGADTTARIVFRVVVGNTGSEPYQFTVQLSPQWLQSSSSTGGNNQTFSSSISSIPSNSTGNGTMASSSSSSPFYPVNVPNILSVSGCYDDQNNRTRNCLPGAILTITGMYWGNIQYVNIATTYNCTIINPPVIYQHILYCRLPYTIPDSYRNVLLPVRLFDSYYGGFSSQFFAVSIAPANSTSSSTGSSGNGTASVTFSITSFSCSSDPVNNLNCAVNDYVSVNITTDGEIDPRSSFTLTLFNSWPADPYIPFGCASRQQIIRSSANRYTLKCALFGIRAAVNFGKSLDLNVLLQVPGNFTQQTIRNVATFVNYPQPLVTSLSGTGCSSYYNNYQCQASSLIILNISNFANYLPRAFGGDQPNFQLGINYFSSSAPNVTYTYFPNNQIFEVGSFSTVYFYTGIAEALRLLGANANAEITFSILVGINTTVPFTFKLQILFPSSSTGRNNFTSSTGPRQLSSTGSSGNNTNPITFSITNFTCSSDPISSVNCAVNDYVNVSIITNAEIFPYTSFSLSLFSSWAADPYFPFGCVSQQRVIRLSAYSYTLTCALFGIGSSANFFKSLDLNVLLQVPGNFTQQTLRNAATFVNYPQPLVTGLTGDGCIAYNYYNYECQASSRLTLNISNFEYYLPRVIGYQPNFQLGLISLSSSARNITYTYSQFNPIFDFADRSRTRIYFLNNIGDTLRYLGADTNAVITFSILVGINSTVPFTFALQVLFPSSSTGRNNFTSSTGPRRISSTGSAPPSSTSPAIASIGGCANGLDNCRSGETIMITGTGFTSEPEAAVSVQLQARRDAPSIIYICQLTSNAVTQVACTLPVIDTALIGSEFSIRVVNGQGNASDWELAITYTSSSSNNNNVTDDSMTHQLQSMLDDANASIRQWSIATYVLVGSIILGIVLLSLTMVRQCFSSRTSKVSSSKSNLPLMQTSASHYSEAYVKFARDTDDIEDGQ